MSVPVLRAQVQAAQTGSIAQRCAALGLARSSYYYQPCGETAQNLALMRLLDEEYTRHCFLGVRGLHLWLHLWSRATPSMSSECGGSAG